MKTEVGRLTTRTRGGARATLASLLLAALCLSLGCEQTPPDPPTQGTGDAGPSAAAPSTRNQLVWKRYRAYEQTLSRGLGVNADELCDELGFLSCVDTVHLVALGGNDPFDQGLHEPLAVPSGTTPVAVERLALSSCQRAVEVDAGRPVQLVFLDLDLSPGAPAIDLTSEAQRFAVEDTAKSLYRRLLSRDPLAEELAALRELAAGSDDEPALTPREYAVLSCFAVATTTEALFL